MSKKSPVDSNNYYLYPEWFEGGNQSQPSTSSYSYPTLEYIWSNAVRLTRTVHSNLQDEIEYLEKNISGSGGSCNCSELQYGIDKNSTKIYYNSVNITSNANKIANLSDIKLSRDGSQPMEGELICNIGLKTDIIKARTQSIIDCQNQLRVYQSLGGDGDSGLWLGSDFSLGAPSINLYPYGSSANGKIFIKTPRSDGIVVPRIEIPGKEDLVNIKIRESHIVPYDDNYQDLGSNSKRWKNIYAVKGNFSGTIVPDAILTNSANISDLDERVDYLEENLSTCNCSALQFGIDSNTTKIENLSTTKLSRDGSQTMTGLLQCETGLKTDTIDSYSGDTVECIDDLKVGGSVLGDSTDGLNLKAEDGEDVAKIELSPGSNGKILMSTPTSQGVVLPRFEISDGIGNVDITISNAHVIPSINNWQDLGSTNKRWRNIYAVLVNSSNISNLEERIEYLESIIGKMGGRGPYTAIIYKDNGIIYAKNANGETITQGAAGTDDATVIKTVLESGGKIIIMPATYTLYFTVTGSTDLITLPQNTIVDGLSREETKLEFYIDGSTPLNYFNVAELVVRSNCVVRNLTIDGKRDYFAGKEYLQYLIAMREGDEKSLYDIVENVRLINSKRCGIVPDCSCSVIRNIIVDDCPQALDSDRVDNLLVEGFVATNCQNAFYFESDVIDVTLRNFYFEPRYRGVYMPLPTATFENIVIEEGTINIPSGLDGWDIYGFEIGAEVKALTVRNVRIRKESAHPGAFKHLVAENLGDIIIENCDVGYMESIFPHGCSNIIVDGGRYRADYVFVNNPSGFLVKNAYIYSAWHVFHDSPSSIHFENCYLSSLGSDGTESDITFRRCSIGDKKSDNSGTATISSGDTSETVTHGLYKAPVHVFLTGTHNEVAKCWVTDISDTEFTINAPSAVTADRDVYWEATIS